MAESSEGWNVDYQIIPGAHRLRGIVKAVRRGVCFLPPSEGYPSEYPKHPERLGREVAQLAQQPMPGEIGGVEVIDYRAAANQVVN